MKSFFLVCIFLITQTTIHGNEKICLGFQDCIDKASKTSIHRKKINFYTEAIDRYANFKSEGRLAKVYLLRAKSIITEASGDTGYRGEIDLKVTHKPEYVKNQLVKAKLDLKFCEKYLSDFSKEENALYVELISKVEINQ
ncbi:hypothetical protein P3G55_10395 [Leptospira sp. 96542]|nr:hypothetical protein [Leptospira sp. 96542]